MKSIPDIDVLEFPSKNMGNVEEMLLVGAGTSTSVPTIACLADGQCTVCLDAVGRLHRTPEYTMKHGGPPTCTGPTRNRRTNPSAVVRYRHSDGTLHSVLIDCGKTFYTNAEKMLEAGVRVLDGVLLTHGHADAISGLDDLRHWAGHYPSLQETVNVYCDKDTFDVIKQTFPYLVDPKCATGGGEVSALTFHIIKAGIVALIEELEVVPIKLLHGYHSDGRDYYANGFRIAGLAYLSDISGFPSESKELLMMDTTLLVVDCLLETKSYRSHYCWPQTERLIKEISPEATILVGMSHRIDYYEFQRRLDKEGGIERSKSGVIDKLSFAPQRVYVGFDGMLIRFVQ